MTFPQTNLTVSKFMRFFRRFEWDSTEYSEAFSCLLRCSSERSVLVPYLRQQINQLPKNSIAADWGAGTGDLTQLLSPHCSPVFAIEPSPAMQQILKQKLPRVQLLAGDILSACPPIQVNYALLAHVLYHLPDEQWLQIISRLLDFQAPGGRLVIILKARESECNQMLERFGADRFDLLGQLASLSDHLPDFDIETCNLPATITTDNYRDTEKIARFMMCDRGKDEFAEPPDESDFVNYVTTNLWDATKNRGGWDYEITICTIKKHLKPDGHNQ